ncbi:MAG TPA: sulfotransferase, partial [Acidimicrobiales bacterium]|nr:sulfotransferase [Acidimicrobiales bacterium]
MTDAGSGTGRLPDFVIAGVPKAATTSVARWIETHPDAWLAPEKEVRFFNVRYDEGLDWYRSRFAGAPPGAVIGEGSPAYIYDDVVVERMARDLPNARFIVLVREPVERAWSNYWFLCAIGAEHRSWRRAMADEARDPGRGPLGLPGYLASGRYEPVLRRLVARVGRDRVHVELFEDLRTDQDAVMARICRFLGLDPARLPPPIRIHNVTRVPRSLTLQRALLRARAPRWPLGIGRALIERNMTASTYDPLPVEEAERLRREFVSS